MASEKVENFWDTVYLSIDKLLLFQMPQYLSITQSKSQVSYLMASPHLHDSQSCISRWNQQWNTFIMPLINNNNINESRAAARKPHDAAAVLFRLKFAVDKIHYKFKSSQSSKAMLQSSRHAKQNLMQNGHSRSFGVMCFGVSWKAIKDWVILNTIVGLIC